MEKIILLNQWMWASQGVIARWLVILALPCIICSVYNNIHYSFNIVTGRPVGFQLEEVTLTDGLDQDKRPLPHGLIFPHKTDLIYCYINGTKYTNVYVTYVIKWYYAEEQLSVHEIEYTSKPVLSWLEPSFNETNFRTGTYRIEIFNSRTLLRTIEFQIE